MRHTFRPAAAGPWQLLLMLPLPALPRCRKAELSVGQVRSCSNPSKVSAAGAAEFPAPVVLHLGEREAQDPHAQGMVLESRSVLARPSRQTGVANTLNKKNVPGSHSSRAMACMPEMEHAG